MAPFWHPSRQADTVPAVPDVLDPDSVDPDPIAQFRRWYDEAVAAGVRQPDAMTLATASPDGTVSARTVLLRGLDERGFVFFTNFESAKGRRARGAIPGPRSCSTGGSRSGRCASSVRCSGSAPRRPRATGRAGRVVIASSASASPQSEVVSRDALLARVAEVEARFPDSDPPLPPFWGGFVVGVDELECWQGRPDRLHDRVRYRADGNGGWRRERLAP